MIIPEITYTIILIIATVILFMLYIIGLIKSRKAGSTGRRAAIPALTLGFLLCVYLVLNIREIKPADWAEIVLLFGLVVVTGVYALSTARQADASLRMAEEMRQQRRPIVVQKAVPFTVIPERGSDYFEIYNDGNGPAIELGIFLLGREKDRLIQKQRETFFLRAGETPIKFYPDGLENHVNSTCYLLCQYRGVIPRDVKQIWYQTWLPFEPVKSVRGGRIIIKSGELEFLEVPEKESY